MMYGKDCRSNRFQPESRSLIGLEYVGEAFFSVYTKNDARNAQIFGGHGLNGLFLGNIVDVHGDSGSAKTELMMNVVANFLVFSGDAKIVYFDNDVRLDVARLGVLLKSRLSNLHSNKRGIRDYLKRVIIFQCQNQIEFMASLFSLNARIQSGEIKLLIVDSWTSFLWDNIANRSASMLIGNRLYSCFRSHRQKSQLVVFGTTNSTIKSSIKFWDRIQSCRLHLCRVKAPTEEKSIVDHDFEARWSECSVKSDYVVKFSVVENGIATI